MRVRLDLAYDGTDFAGWAIQPGQRTVQGEVEAGLARLLQTPTRLTVAGRTDAGVHAVGQVAHADVRRVPAARAVNAVLPPDVRIRGVRAVPGDFDARFAGLWRRYTYRICDGPANPLHRRFVATWTRPLDVDRMQAAASSLLGLHDFGAFCRAREFGTTIRTLEQFDVVRDGDELSLTVRADAFCHSMVRSLVGALAAVGERSQPVDWPASLLTQRTRFVGARVAPAHGLTLLEVGYPPDDQLAARTSITRAQRDQS